MGLDPRSPNMCLDLKYFDGKWVFDFERKLIWKRNGKRNGSENRKLIEKKNKSEMES